MAIIHAEDNHHVVILSDENVARLLAAFPDANLATVLNQIIIPAYFASPQDETEEYKRCQSVVNRASFRERSVLKAIASGLHPKEAAKELDISVITVSSHLSNLYAYCRIAWEIPKKQQMSYHFLQEKFKKFNF